MSGHDPRDLVVVALSGVQRFITESRTTVDLRSASQIVAHLATEAVRHLHNTHKARIVFPSLSEGRVRGTDDGMPNRVVALVPAGQGPTAASATAERLTGVWEGWVTEVFDQPMHATPGWPVVQWVSVPAAVGPYPVQWHEAQRSLAERKTVRDFAQPWDEPEELCTLSPRWRSAPPPAVVEQHMKHMANEKLAVANWVKRLWHRKTRTGRSSGFASTNALASSPYRAEVLRLWEVDPDIGDAVGDLQLCAEELGDDPIGERPLEHLPRVADSEEADWVRGRGSRWVFPASWHLDALAREFKRDRADAAFARTVRDGWEAARRLAKVMARHGVDPLSPHLAVLVQDLDSMGRHLSGRRTHPDREPLEVGEKSHTDISRLLSGVAAGQRAAITAAGGVVVYAGGDDLLALVPAAAALEAARACQETIPPALPTASTGLLFFHHDSSLSQALGRARDLLDLAKERPGKHALGVGFVRHSGAHGHCVLPWSADPAPDESLRVFLPRGEHARIRLSPGLLGDLAAEAAHLDGGDAELRVRDQDVLPPPVARAEIRRLVLRHTALGPGAEGRSVEADRALLEGFARHAATHLEHLSPAGRLVDEDAVRIALFLRQEAS
ncbi:type III-B CRISPR-associated protein Cas10/Cmr2 [Nocardiopsis sp. N85]|uniref:Cas10/Cmr2 second palm domain-containing protein n=1 Tax=Nocardiopsis sp. N85 TaxID=3029400 RepID=UPI00237FB83C|nr:type III-B CRISPR-associated protein Cas10/Cmr2 [Nocardiopsis sp. N85]MDE3725305.1 type III-B CRISPR-associated protein Cas10/Cmr2 [Nocardiopsis sp. N85]